MRFEILAIKCFLCSYFFNLIYKKIALKHGPLSYPNNRSLHKMPVPVGGGVAIAISSLVGISLIYKEGYLSQSQLILYGIASSITCLVGIIDERINIRPRYQFITQVISSSFTIYSLKIISKLKIFATIDILFYLTLIFTLIIMIWFYNAFNFIDGSDGMASVGTIFVSFSMMLLLSSKGFNDISLILLIISSSTAGFLIFNKPKASIFMGDSGTKYLSFILLATILESSIRDFNIIFVWSTIGGLYIVDTTLTTLTRLFTVPGFWKGHRTHAYQNLARAWGHNQILKFSLLVNLIWCLPMGILGFMNPNHAPFICLISFIPLIIYNYNYGPRFSELNNS